MWQHARGSGNDRSEPNGTTNSRAHMTVMGCSWWKGREWPRLLTHVSSLGSRSLLACGDMGLCNMHSVKALHLSAERSVQDPLFKVSTCLSPDSEQYITKFHPNSLISHPLCVGLTQPVCTKCITQWPYPRKQGARMGSWAERVWDQDMVDCLSPRPLLP